MIDLIVGGFLALTVVIGSIICDELSREEEQKQLKALNEYREYQRNKQAEYAQSKAYYENARRRAHQLASEELEQYQKEQLLKKKEQNKGLYNRYINLYKERRAQKDDLISKLREQLNLFENNKEKNQNTYTRYRSLKQTLITLQEAIYKLEAYIAYLDDWEIHCKELYQESGDIIEPFDFKLPEGYPYVGKIEYYYKSDFQPSENGMFIRSPFLPYPIWLDKSDREIFEKSDSSSQLPFMVYKIKNGKYYLSLTKGIIKKSIGSTTGIKVQVMDKRGTWIRLGYNRNEYPYIYINQNELKEKNHKTPIGSSMQVFIKDYDFALQKTIHVSEKPAEGFTIEQFGDIFLIESKAEYTELKELYEYLRENNLLQEADEWRIAPIYESDGKNLIRFKMQQGNNYAFKAYFDNTSFGKERVALKYGGLIKDKNDYISFDDVFVTTNVSVQARNPEKIKSNIDSYASYFEECQKLYLYLVSEFANQKRIMEKTPMNTYLSQWAVVTKRLIDKKSYGWHKNIHIDQRNRKNWNTVRLLVSDADENKIKQFIEKQDKMTNYFIVLDSAPEKKLHCNVAVNDEIAITVKDEGMIDDQTLMETNFTLPLYTLRSTYPEQQQFRAFEAFRDGRVASDSIKSAIINVSALKYTDNGNRITHFFNSGIQANKAQSDAVTRAFASKDFFIIQGPPGTGKTTVIKELICQQLYVNPQARILVVSQANVAVDNVIRGIVQQGIISADSIIRCGSEDKVAEDIAPYLFDGRISAYQDSLTHEFPEDQRILALRKKWLEILQENKDSSIIGECLLKQYQVIGATCVGLEKRRFGLSDMEFDIVIIDEAGKALPGELLIPINRAKKLIVIGDHKQLPPVVDPELYKNGTVDYDDVVTAEERDDFIGKSFFHRLYEDCPPDLKCMLDIQFRMPPVIANLVNLFYDGKLRTGANCIHKKPLFLGNNLIFIDMKDVPDYKESTVGVSVINAIEATALVTVASKIRTFYKKRIVVLTPYKGQKREIEDAVRQASLEDVYVNTIDALQGDEEDVVIYCTTRSVAPTKYFSDASRLNVAFSRARNTLIFLGSSFYLLKYKKQYGEDHVMSRVGDYILKNARITSYSEWLDLSQDLQYHAVENPVSVATPCNDNTTIQHDAFNTDFFDRLQTKQQETVQQKQRKCVACSKVLEDWEDVLCSSCLNKSISKPCPKCGGTIVISLYDKYIGKQDEPTHCTNCIEVTCVDCGKKFLQSKKWKTEIESKGRKILCLDCFQKQNELVKVGICSVCGKEITFKRYMLEKNPNLKNAKIHKDCKVEVTCTNCGKTFLQPKNKLLEIKEHGGKFFCLDCFQKQNELVKVGICSVCGKEITFKRYMLEKNPNLNDTRLHKDCRDKIYTTVCCKECNRKFVITFGEKDFYESRGQSLPARCKPCRDARKK